jgi:hypothetical protein
MLLKLIAFVFIGLWEVGPARASLFEIDQEVKTLYICDSGNTCRMTTVGGEDQLFFKFVSDQPEVRTIGGREFLGHEIELSHRWRGRILGDQNIFIPEEEVLRIFDSLILAQGFDEMAAVSIDGIGIIRDLNCQKSETAITPLSQFNVREQCQVEGTDAQWRRNCELLYEEGIPEDALNFTLEFLRLNATSFRTSACFATQGLRSNADHPSQNGLTEDTFRDNYMQDGISNKCQIVINDTDARLPGYTCRARMYYIDLCHEQGPQVVKTYFNLGTGTCTSGRGFRNGSGLFTTVLGAFVTNNNPFDFHPLGSRSIQPYNRLRAEVEGHGGPREATAVGLFGLQNTNNLSMANGKHMHVSPYVSSNGCPSIAGENWWMIRELAQNGPSLVVNYARNAMEDPAVCTE